MFYYRTAAGNFLTYLVEPVAVPESCSQVTHTEWLIGNGGTQADVDAYARALVESRIQALEQKHIAPRWQREFAMGVMQSMATPEQLAVNYGYKAVKTLDDQIAALRAQLEAL